MNTKNIVRIEGRLTEEPVFVKNGEGKEFQVKFTLAVPRSYKNKQGEIEADFIPCRMSKENRLKLAHSFKKPQWLEVIGEIRTAVYEKDGKRVYTWWLELDDYGWLPYNVPAEESRSVAQNNTSVNQQSLVNNVNSHLQQSQENYGNPMMMSTQGNYPNQGNYMNQGQNMSHRPVYPNDYAQNQGYPYNTQRQNTMGNGNTSREDDIFKGLDNITLPV